LAQVFRCHDDASADVPDGQVRLPAAEPDRAAPDLVVKRPFRQGQPKRSEFPKLIKANA
jgi:hypothetical protein